MEYPQQIQLELPDYRQEYLEYMERKQKEQDRDNKQEETVFIIDISN